MMEKQQKILEMAKDICRVKLNCNDVCNPISACDALRYAERAVEAGYSKQSEGEWKKTCVPDVFQCTNCKRPTKMDELCDSAILRAYCPNCGAKMKGGAE